MKKDLDLLDDSDGLGQVTWAVDVIATQNSNMIGEKLQRNDGQDTLKSVYSARDADEPLAQVVGLIVALVADDDRVATARVHLLVSVEALGLDRIVHDDHEDWHVRVDHGQWAVLQLACQYALRVHVRELFHLECALEACRVLVAAAHDQ